MVSCENVDIFDERACPSARFCGPLAIPHAFLREQVLQNFYERAVSTHEVNRVLLILFRMRKPQSNEGFP
jgi:hypothetical protein